MASKRSSPRSAAWRTLAGTPATRAARVATAGFYTQDQVRGLVAYAAARNITIVPEIEMPGHALSAILAYPELGLKGDLTAANQGDWGVFPSIFNADEHTFSVLDDVLTEVMALFPSPYIAVGGDEAVKDLWKGSPAVQARMKALGVADEAALQSYFTRRIGTFLNAHGRRLIGWDEILEGGPLPADDAVISWRGESGAVAAAKSGHDVVLATAPVLYFDNRQGVRSGQRAARTRAWSAVCLRAWKSAMSTASTTSAGGSERRGAPCPRSCCPRRSWPGPGRSGATTRAATSSACRPICGRSISAPRREVEAMAFPRAPRPWPRSGWTRRGRRARTGRTSPHACRRNWRATRPWALTLRGPRHARGARRQKNDDALGGMQVTLSNQLAVGQIRYTTDGGEPTPGSPAYDKPLSLAASVTGRAATFDGARRRTPPPPMFGWTPQPWTAGPARI